MCRPFVWLFALSLALEVAPAGADDTQVAAGRALFEAKCRRCHGPTAQAGQAGDIRSLPASVVARATRGIEEMPAVELSDAELGALVAYLRSLRGG